MNTANNQKVVMMTTSEVAEYLRISTASIYRLVKMKEIPASKIGRQLRFRKDVIDNWLSRKESEHHKA
jgi:excisionase family DNA binding protein